MPDAGRAPVPTGGTPALVRKYGGYVSPDRYERNREAIDHAEAENRRRVLDNRSGGLG